MASGPGFRPSVRAARERLAEGREKLRAQHDGGSPSFQVCARWTDVLDTVVIDLYESALADLGLDAAGRVVLVPHGGYGRRDGALYSDVDLMVVHALGAEQQVAPLAQRLVQDIFDVGLDLGLSVRTVRQACQLARRDAEVFSSLAESRFLCGSVSLYRRFMDQFLRQSRSAGRAMIVAIDEARCEERAKFGDTVYLLAPNVKRSHGALRDIQLLRWVGFARYGQTDPESLYRAGELSTHDFRALRRASEFLLKVRNELHFHAGKRNDVLDRDEQIRMAEKFGFAGDDGVLPVERFMQEYFRHTSEVRDVTAHFVATAKQRPWRQQFANVFLSHRMDHDFWVGPTTVGATRRSLDKVRGSVSQVLRLMDLANRYGRSIDHRTWQAIRETMAAQEMTLPLGAAAERFLSLMSQPGPLGELLRQLHNLGVLEKLVPAMAHARCLIQFNDYHKFTVDEHCIRAVEAATKFIQDEGPLGHAYRSIGNKRVLHLALLIHDLGKGFVEDHSEVGLRIAQETAARLRLPNSEAETLCFLVHKHLVMSHLGLRRNVSDEALVVNFAVEVGSPEVLQMLYVLTCADFAAVGPGVLNRWKLELLTELYHAAMRHLAGDASGGLMHDKAEERRERLAARVAKREDAEWYLEQVALLPASYLTSNSPSETEAILKRLHELSSDEAISWSNYRPETGAVEFSIGTNESITPGIFHRLCGALASHGLQILSAEIHTLAHGLVLDQFSVNDPDNTGKPPADRLEEVHRSLVAALCNETPTPPSFRRTWQGEHPFPPPKVPTRIRFDNNTSQQFTIIDVFTHDRAGLLYSITRALFELGLSISVAKIATHLDQVVDVFYVTDEGGNKVSEHAQHAIRERLLAEIDQGASHASSRS
ncbi:MAG: [protein-PII] uridylyltransferase [Pirellulales bacterium]